MLPDEDAGVKRQSLPVSCGQNPLAVHSNPNLQGHAPGGFESRPPARVSRAAVRQRTPRRSRRPGSSAMVSRRRLAASLPGEARRLRARGPWSPREFRQRRYSQGEKGDIHFRLRCLPRKHQPREAHAPGCRPDVWGGRGYSTPKLSQPTTLFRGTLSSSSCDPGSGTAPPPPDAWRTRFHFRPGRL